MKSKIRTPFLVLLLVIPVLTLILFNLTMRIYVDKAVKKELQTTVLAVEAVVKSEVSGSILSLTGSSLDNAFAKLGTALMATKISVDVEMMFFSRKRELVYPEDENTGFITDRLVQKTLSRLPDMHAQKTYSTIVDGQRYYILAYPLTKLTGNRPTIVFAAKIDEARSFIFTVNIILLIVLIVTVGVAVYAADRVSVRLVRPVTRLCGVARVIGQGDFSLAEQTGEKSGIQELDYLYESMREMAGRLEASDRAQKTFFQNASHEIKTPLMSIQGYAEGIASGVLQDTKQAAEVIGVESRRLNELVEQILTLSRLESPDFRSEPMVLNLSDVLRDYVQRLEGVAAKQKKQLMLSLPEGPVDVNVDETLLSQALLNITSNGLRYAASRVDIMLTREERFAIIRITDDGGGIATEDLPHIFERFYKGKGGLFGLGLSIAKSGVELMEGILSVRNGEMGAIFEIVLPLRR